MHFPLPDRTCPPVAALGLLVFGCTTLGLPPPSPVLRAHVEEAGALVAAIGAELPEVPARPDARARDRYALALNEIEAAGANAAGRQAVAVGVGGRIVAADILASIDACRDAILRLRTLHEGAGLTRDLFGMSHIERTCRLPAESDALLAEAEAPQP